MPHERGDGRPRKHKDVHERALGLLAVRQRSRREVERRLQQGGFEADEISRELERLEQVGLIDDEAFARTLVEHSFGTRKEGRRVAASRLVMAGIAAETAETVLGEVTADEEERAGVLAGAKAAKMSGLPPDAAYRRLYGMLARRGYAPNVAARVARRALAVEAVED